VVPEFLVVPIKGAALLLPVQLQQATVAIQMEHLDAFRGRGQHREAQEVDARLGQHTDQAREVDLGHTPAQNLAPELVGVDHVRDLLARSVAHGEAADQRQHRAGELLLRSETVALAIETGDGRPRRRDQSPEPCRTADLPGHEDQATVRRNRRPDLHLNPTHVNDLRPLRHHPLGDTTPCTGSNTGAGLIRILRLG